ESQGIKNMFYEVAYRGFNNYIIELEFNMNIRDFQKIIVKIDI
ncbi:4812_t:CDS:1, partial [Funneliformis geosporum]